MPSCCVPLCQSHTSKNDRTKKLSYHEFPSNADLCGVWLKVISRDDFVPNDVSPSSVVCSKHFKDGDFREGCKLRVLKRGAVPSIFPGYPSYLIPIQNYYHKVAKEQIVRENYCTTMQQSTNLDKSKTSHLKKIELSSYQFGLMVDYMTLNPELISGKLTSTFTKYHKKEKWDELSSLLNSDGLGTKSKPWEWEMCWSDLKHHINLKDLKIQEHQKKYGEASGGLEKFSELEEKVLKMICTTETESFSNEIEFKTGTPSTLEIQDVQEIKERDEGCPMNYSAFSANVSTNIESIGTSDTYSLSDDVLMTSLQDTVVKSNRLNNSRRNASRFVTKRTKTARHPSFKAKKQTTLIQQIQRQNVLLEKVAGSVERIEKFIENFSQSSHLMYEKSRLLKNIAASMEQSATTLNMIKKFC